MRRDSARMYLPVCQNVCRMLNFASRRVTPNRPATLTGSKAPSVVETYAGAIVTNSPVRACMSPDGTYVHCCVRVRGGSCPLLCGAQSPPTCADWRLRVHASWFNARRFVLAGSEDGEACLWNTQTQRRVTTPGLLVGFDTMCLPVAWHPKQHLFAVAAFGTPRPRAVHPLVPAVLSCSRGFVMVAGPWAHLRACVPTHVAT